MANDAQQFGAALSGIVQEAIAGSRDVDGLLQMKGLELTPLMVACQWKNFNSHLGTEFSSDTVAALLNAGSDPNIACPDNGVTALFFAVKYTDIKTVDLLLNAQADVQARDRPLGRSVLFNATETCDLDIIARLLERGVDPAERSDRVRAGAGEITINVAEKMLIVSPESYTSWKLIGPPPIMSLVRAFERMLLGGATLGDTALIFCGNVLQDFRTSGDSGRTPAPQLALAQAAFGVEYKGQVRVKAKLPKSAPPPPRAPQPSSEEPASAEQTAARTMEKLRFQDDPTRFLGGVIVPIALRIRYAKSGADVGCHAARSIEVGVQRVD